MASTNPARGMRDFLPADIRKRNYVIDIIKNVYESYGFEPLETPSVENTEISFYKTIVEDSQNIEAETIFAVNDVLTRLAFEDFVIRLNHHQVLVDILDTVGIDEAIQIDAINAIGEFDLRDVDSLVDELTKIGVSSEASTMLIEIFSGTREILNQEHNINPTIVSNLINIVTNEILFELGFILKSVGKAPVLIDPSLARVSPNCTGIILDANVAGHASSLGNGGCYVNPIGSSGDEQVSVFAFSLHLDNIIGLMETNKMFPREYAESGSAGSLH